MCILPMQSSLFLPADRWVVRICISRCSTGDFLILIPRLDGLQLQAEHTFPVYTVFIIRRPTWRWLFSALYVDARPLGLAHTASSRAHVVEVRLANSVRDDLVVEAVETTSLLHFAIAALASLVTLCSVMSLGSWRCLSPSILIISNLCETAKSVPAYE